MTTPLEHALLYAQRGWPVFPVHSVREGGRCRCGRPDCGSPGKHPMTQHGLKHGHKDATTDLAKIRDWWTKAPDANIGIVTGSLSGLAVIDIDPRNGGVASLPILGDLYPSIEIETGGGGQHLYFAIPNGSTIASKPGFLPGIDIKGDGGYVVATPSLHASGGAYRIAAGTIDAELAPLPAAIAGRLSGSEPKRKRRPFPSPLPTHAERLIGALREKGCNPTLQREEFWANCPHPKHDDRNPSFSLGYGSDGQSILHCFGGCPPEEIVSALGLTMADLYPSSPEPTAGPTVIRLADVVPEDVMWLWPGRIPLRCVTLLSGNPGLGKSFVTVDIAARVSMGRAWPGVPGIAQVVGDVVILSAEDDVADTIRPRFDAAGGDASRVHVIKAAVRNIRGKDVEDHFDLDKDLDQLDRAIADRPTTRLVIIDPITAYLGKIDSHKHADVQGLLAKLNKLARRHGVAVVVVTHKNKAQGVDRLDSVTGSKAFVSAARCAWSFEKSNDDPDLRLIVPIKNNYGDDSTGLAYRIVEDPSGPRVQWELGERHDQKPQGRGRPPTEREEAKAFIRRRLREGPRESADLLEEGVELGFSEKTLRRAFKDLGGKPKKSKGTDGKWIWELEGNLAGFRVPNESDDTPATADGARRDQPLGEPPLADKTTDAEDSTNRDSA